MQKKMGGGGGGIAANDSRESDSYISQLKGFGNSHTVFGVFLSMYAWVMTVSNLGSV